MNSKVLFKLGFLLANLLSLIRFCFTGEQLQDAAKMAAQCSQEENLQSRIENACQLSGHSCSFKAGSLFLQAFSQHTDVNS